MLALISRIGALLIAIGLIVAAICHEHELNRTVLSVFLALLFPLTLIWFPEELGSYLGPAGRGSIIDTETPAGLISCLGWLFLVGFPVFFYFWFGTIK